MARPATGLPGDPLPDGPRPDGTDPGRSAVVRSRPQRMHDAFAAWISETLNTGDVTRDGGEGRTTLTRTGRVRIDYRLDAIGAATLRPAAFHANYHPDKLARMQAVAAAFFEGDWGPVMTMPGGSEPGS